MPKTGSRMLDMLNSAIYRISAHLAPKPKLLLGESQTLSRKQIGLLLGPLHRDKDPVELDKAECGHHPSGCRAGAVKQPPFDFASL